MATRWICAALLVAIAALGCAPTVGDGYLKAMAAGERAYSAGRYDEAATSFDAAAGEALRIKDRDEALFLVARAHLLGARWPAAKAALERLVATSPTGPRTARATFDLADLEIDHGDPQRGHAMLFAATLRYPGHGVAGPAWKRLVLRAKDERGAEGAAAWVKEVAPGFQGTELDEMVVYDLASLLEEAGRHDEARSWFIAVASAHPYPYGALTDDAWWRAAEIDEARGQHEAALAHLRALLAPREVSTMNGSYERPRFSAAQLRIAEILRDGIGDHAAARREFRKLATSFPTSILRDDALWAEAKLARIDSDAEGACDAARLLVREIPDSRYAACARLVCPDAKAGERPCADYIARDLDRLNERAEAAPAE